MGVDTAIAVSCDGAQWLVAASNVAMAWRPAVVSNVVVAEAQAITAHKGHPQGRPPRLVASIIHLLARGLYHYQNDW